MDDAKDGGNTLNLSFLGRLRTVEQIGENCNTDKKALNETGITKISPRPNNRMETEQKLTCREKTSPLDELSNVMNNKTLKRTPINLSRKAKSFFRKKSRLAITDSDCTLILPGSRLHVKGKQYERTRLKVSQLLRKKNGISGTNSNVVRMNKSDNAKQAGRRMNSLSLTNLQAGDPFEEPSSIPLETQELLNQSYWEYYWRLRRKIALADKPDNAGERDKSRPSKESRERLPESQTLQQCSVLSCMINTVLRDSTAVDGRSSSDPIVSTFVARENICHESSGVFAKKVKRRKTTKRVSKRLLGLRIIGIHIKSMYVHYNKIDSKSRNNRPKLA
ncbi:LOW QUALITY PROTEIN: uncharacterized protein LOC114928560 [Nylanderia fulva]|uniref:LOW QUALITY PROTEIN: uncharacterized protein LOC114928560 n=1 Tax=Nylanderia fulva TaxID=613905 RepID=UPI0010FB1EE6|nr:LOW QUALITY PROTEIN: uncharacterized protein LOC114928560 [Nylanderia fulva]